MNKFEKQLEKWNNGVLRGAQAKLAKLLGVSTATTALWATGKRRPSKGYVAQMAKLFGLDIYQVIKLFEVPSSIIYPTPAAPLHALREEEPSARYSSKNPATEQNTVAQRNTVLIPLLAKAPLGYPTIAEEDILEWWSLPRRYMPGIKYILRSCDIGLNDAHTETDLCFIKPCPLPDHEQAVLLTDTRGGVCVCRAIRRQNSLSYQSLSGARLKNTKDYTVLGVILYRIKPF